MNVFEVGTQVCMPSNDSVQFEITDGGAMLILKFSRPTSKEKRDFKNGVPQFAFTVVNDIIFFLSRFGTGSWMDAPYYRKLSSIDVSKLTVPQSPMGLSLHAMLIDASNGVLVAQKMIGLPTELSQNLVIAIQNQPEIPDYDVRLTTTMAMYNTDDLVSMTKD